MNTAITELQAITEGLNLLRAHGLTTARTYQDGLFVAVPTRVLSVQLVRSMRELNWLWHQHDSTVSGFVFQLSPL